MSLLLHCGQTILPFSYSEIVRIFEKSFLQARQRKLYWGMVSSPSRTLVISLTIDVKRTGRDHFGIDRNICVWEPNSVEDQFQITFAPKMTWLFLSVQVSCHVCTAREYGMPEFLHHTDVTKYGITHLGCLRGKIRLVECAP